MNGCKQCPAYAKCTVVYRGSACAALRWSYGIDTDPEIVNTTDRDKLCELIKDGRMCPVDGNPFEEEKCMSCKYREDRDCDITRLADYLIANGVTFAKDTNVPGKWISVEDEKPKRRGHYFIAYKFAGSDMHFYGEAFWHDDIPDNGYVQGNHFSNEGVGGMYVTHWMEIQKLPKGGMLGE